MNIHIIGVNDSHGDLIDCVHLCSALCQSEALSIMGYAATTGAGEQSRESASVDYGAWPGGCETDYDVWCANCGAFLWHGLECECPDKSVDRDPVLPWLPL